VRVHFKSLKPNNHYNISLFIMCDWLRLLFVCCTPTSDIFPNDEWSWHFSHITRVRLITIVQNRQTIRVLSSILLYYAYTKHNNNTTLSNIISYVGRYRYLKNICFRISILCTYYLFIVRDNFDDNYTATTR